MDAFACHLGQLRVDEQFDVWLGERKVDVIYRLFLIEDLLDPTGPALIEPVLRAAERGKVKIFSPMDAELYGSKGALALLSDEANRGVFSPDELEVPGPDPALDPDRAARAGHRGRPQRAAGGLRAQRPRGADPQAGDAARRRRRDPRLADRAGRVGRAAGGVDERAVRAAAAHPPAHRAVPLRRRPDRVAAGLGRLPRRPRLLRHVPARRAGRATRTRCSTWSAAPPGPAASTSSADLGDGRGRQPPARGLLAG